MIIATIGLGYVGSTTLGCMAELGHELIGVDVNKARAKALAAGAVPVTEPGLNKLVSKHVDSGRIRATTDLNEALAEADCAFVCVGTPSTRGGMLDDSVLRSVVLEIMRVRLSLDRVVPVLVRSTALPISHGETMKEAEKILDGRQPLAYTVHPEFLREGTAVDDFFNPPKIVFGTSDEAAWAPCPGLYPDIEAPQLRCGPKEASMLKYADNCFHALKVTFANEIGLSCAAMGVDSREVMRMFCEDRKLNISDKYFRPGFAYGGSCLGKDLAALTAYCRREFVEMPMLANIRDSNEGQIDQLAERIMEHNPSSVGLFGLAFKADTDDLRDSALVKLAERLRGKGVEVKAFDPGLDPEHLCAPSLCYLRDTVPQHESLLTTDPEAMVRNSDVVVLGRHFPQLDLNAMPWREDQPLYDLDGGGELPKAPQNVGLYW